MDWFTELFTEHTFIQAVMVLSLICAVGLALGKIKILGVSLGVTFVFFAGIAAGHFGAQIDPHMLALAQNFGLIIYIYALGLQVGPGFFSSFKKLFFFQSFSFQLEFLLPNYTNYFFLTPLDFSALFT